MSVTDVFIRRPVLAVVISLLLCLLGGMGYQLLGVRETPDVESPVVTVTTSWVGADPAIVESDVTEPLERELNGIEGVRTLSSTSQDGRSEITVEFELERDLEDAANDVRSRVARARRQLPDEVDEPTVEKSDASGQPIMFLRLAGEGSDLLEITEVADTIVRSRIENVPGVSGVDLFGAQAYAMRLDLDAARMASRGVTVSDLERALQAGNVELPTGRIEGQSTQLTLHLDGGLRTPEQFGALVVRADDAGRVYLRDVATVRLGGANERTAARADGVPSISVAIMPQAKANVVDISDEVRARLPEVQDDLPAGMSLDLVFDRADSVRTSIHDVQLTLLVAFALVVAVIFAFLRDLRATLVPALAIPVSIVATFLVLWIAGFTINVFTLFGLVLAIGLVVDDAIVVLENIVRHMEEGASPFDAAILATREISGAVVATTLVLVVVFLPVVFTGGATGRLFLEFGVTVAASVAISMIVALTLTPMLTSRLVRVHAKHDATPGLLDRVFRRTLHLVLKSPWLVLPVLAGALLTGVLGISTIPREFFPIEDRNSFIIRTEAQEGATFEFMDARTRELEALLIPLVPERRVALARVASGRGGIASPTNTGMLFFSLKPRGERDRSQQEIVDSLRGPLSQVTALRAIPIQFPTVGRGFSTPLQFVVQHPDFDTLAASLGAFVQAVRETPGLSSVNEDLKLDRPELNLTIDREKAAALGVPLREVARTLQVLTGGIDISTFKRGVRQYDVVAELERGGRDEPGDLGGVYVRAADGSLVPLSNLVTTEERTAASTRYHYQRAPSATISANVDGITLGEGIERVEALAREKLPPGFRTALAGQAKDFAEGTSSLATMFVLALLLVYLLLAAQFDSFVAPVSIMLSVPLALAGAFAALQVTGMTLSFFAQVGLILLVGLVTKNGILIVEYARHLREDEGLGPWEAAEKATRLRFRPILMTSVATIGGALPIAFGLSGSSRSALGVAVAGGMLSATILTLYVTPVVYAALASIGRKRVVAVAALGLAVAMPARAMTLGEALRAAETGNYDVRAAEADVSGAEATADAARAAWLPSVSASGVAAWESATGTYAFAGARADVPLLDLSALAASRAARLDARAAAADRDATLEATLTEVARRFVALQRAREAVAAVEARRGHAQRLVEVAEGRVQVGAAPAIDRTRARLELRTAEARLLEAGTAEASARFALAEAIGAPLDEPIDVAGAAPLLDPASVPSDAALAEALAAARDARPALVAARARLDAAAADRRASQADGLPSVGAWGEAGVLTGVGPTAEAGVQASVPLFEGGGRVATVRARRAVEEEQALALAEAERAVEAEVRLALRVARDAAAGLAVAGDALALAREELERAEARYRAGEGDNLAVVAAQASLAEAELANVDALAAFNLAVVGWYAARGEARALAR
ncbi:MAG: efflux RND transporter permease subunit [Myxococcota bacterium]